MAGSENTPNMGRREFLTTTATVGGAMVFRFWMPPRAQAASMPVIHGQKSGIIRINQMQLYPQRKLIVAAMPGIIDQMIPGEAFLGVWSYDDNGDVPPRWKIPANDRTQLKKPFGVVLDTKHKEVIISDMRNQGVLVFSMPEIF